MPIQFKRRKAASWSQTNEVLADGEPGYEKGTGRLKIGNGFTPWNDLPYFTEGVPEDNGEDGGEVNLPDGVPTFRGIYDPSVAYLKGDMVLSKGVAWFATAPSQGELPALPTPDVNPLSALATTKRGSNIKPYAAPYLPFHDSDAEWGHYTRYFDLWPGGSIRVSAPGASYGTLFVYTDTDGSEIYNSVIAGTPAPGPHEVHNLQPGRYVVDNFLVNTNKGQGTAGYIPTVTIEGFNGAVLWGVDNSDAVEPSWVPLAPPVG